MNRFRLFRIIYYVGFIYLCISVYFLILHIARHGSLWDHYLLEHIIASVSAMLIGRYGPFIFGFVERYPYPVVCAECRKLTVTNPCQHCQADVFSLYTKIPSEKKKILLKKTFIDYCAFVRKKLKKLIDVVVARCSRRNRG